MICKSRLIVVAVFLLPLLPQPVLAGSMRCGTHIISSGGRQGTNKYEVLKKCGEPTIRSGNTWIYESTGGGRRVVVFDADDNVASIK
jgi:Protein of unknown function (DUF2845)